MADVRQEGGWRWEGGGGRVEEGGWKWEGGGGREFEQVGIPVHAQ